MAEIEITLPTVQYGNVKVRATPEELGMDLSDAGAIGHGVAIYLNLFQQGFKAGSGADVDWSPSEPSGAPQGVSKEAAPGDPQAAADRLADGRSPRTVDEAHEMAKQVIENELGPTTEVADDAAPWDKPAAEVKKPWESDVTAPAVLDAAW